MKLIWRNEVLHWDVIDPAKQKDRERFAAEVIRLKEDRYRNLAVDSAEIEQRLLGLIVDDEDGGDGGLDNDGGARRTARRNA